MATYLIDYENVSKDGLNGVTRLTEDDTVIIFYSERADKMTFGLHRRLNETKAKIEYKKVEVGGHNALDFQLATYLGFLVAKNSSEEYIVVSHDRGFEYLVGFWRKPLYDVCLTRAIAESPQAEERKLKRRSIRKGTGYQDVVKAVDLPSEVSEKDAELSGETSVVLVEKQPLAVIEEKSAAIIAVKMPSHPASAAGDVLAEEPMIAEPAGDVADEHTDALMMAAAEPAEEVATAGAAEDPMMDESAEDVAAGPSEVSMMTEPAVEVAGAVVDETVPVEPAEAIAEESGDVPKRTRKRRSSGRGRRKKAVIPNLPDVKTLLKGSELQDKDLEEIAGFIDHYKTKQGVNNALVRKFGNQKGGEIYQSIKTLLNDKKGRGEPKTADKRGDGESKPAGKKGSGEPKPAGKKA